MRDRRVQFLAVQWRTSLKLDVDEEKRREDNGLDNEFSLAGIVIYHLLYSVIYMLLLHRYHSQEFDSICARLNEQRPHRHPLFHEVCLLTVFLRVTEVSFDLGKVTIVNR